MAMAEELSTTHKFAGWPAKVKSYIEELRLEMRRVTWPAWKQVRATTGVVIAAVFGFAIYFFVVDAIIGRGVTKLFDIFTK
jgi:preprotein translocase subunit SecE